MYRTSNNFRNILATFECCNCVLLFALLTISCTLSTAVSFGCASCIICNSSIHVYMYDVQRWWLKGAKFQIALRDGCKRILVKDCFQLLHRLVKIQCHGVRVEDQICQSCRNKLIVNGNSIYRMFFTSSRKIHVLFLARNTGPCTLKLGLSSYRNLTKLVNISLIPPVQLS